MASCPERLSPRVVPLGLLGLRLKSHESSQCPSLLFLDTHCHQGVSPGKHLCLWRTLELVTWEKERGPTCFHTPLAFVCSFTTFPPKRLADPVAADRQSGNALLVGLRALRLSAPFLPADCLGPGCMGPGRPQVTSGKPRQRGVQTTAASAPACPSPCR